MSIYRLPQVVRLTGLSRSTIYAEIAAERFPKQVQLSPRCVGWYVDDIAHWLVERAGRTPSAYVSRPQS